VIASVTTELNVTVTVPAAPPRAIYPLALVANTVVVVEPVNGLTVIVAE
jgi:hypothetical protein